MTHSFILFSKVTPKRVLGGARARLVRDLSDKTPVPSPDDMQPLRQRPPGKRVVKKPPIFSPK